MASMMHAFCNEIDPEYDGFLKDLEDFCKETEEWLQVIRAEFERSTADETFLLPKTPKQRRRRVPLQTVLEDQNTSSRNPSVCSPRRTRSKCTRNTNAGKENLENVLPETGYERSSRRIAAKNAQQKIKSALTELQNNTVNQSRNVESLKRASNEEIEDQRPSKSRRIEECSELELMVPLVQKLNMTVTKEIRESSVDVHRGVTVLDNKVNTTYIKSKVSHTLVAPEGASAEMLLVPLVEKLDFTTEKINHTHETLAINTVNQKQNDNRSLDQNDDNAPILAVTIKDHNHTAGKMSHKECGTVRQSTERMCRLSQNKSSFGNDENLRDSQGSSVATKGSLLQKQRKSLPFNKDNKMNVSLKDAKNAANITVTMESKNKANITFEIVSDENNSASAEIDSIPDDVAGVGNESRRSSPRNSKVLIDLPTENVNDDEARRNIQSPILSNAGKVSKFGHHSTQNAKSTKPVEKKSTEVFSPYANEPVRERVAAFERLQAVNEEPAESSPSERVPARIARTKTRAMAKAEAAAAAKSGDVNVNENESNENTAKNAVSEEAAESSPSEGVPARIARTKTRAMAKAEAAAAAKSGDVNVNENESNENTAKNLYSQNVWKAARKSVAKAKERTNKRQMQDKYVVDESEISKENPIISSSTKYISTPCSINRSTPLSSSNINSTTNSVHRIVGFGSSAGRFPANKIPGNIVVGVESFISKQHVKPTLEEIREMKEEEIKRRREKEDEARRKREEAIKEKAEETKRKREEKMMKVLKQHEALVKQKQASELRQQKEKEKKLKLTMQEREEKIKEQVMQKKQQAQQKAAEIEERRRQEEAARLAKLKEQEEVQRRLQATKKKEQEELAKRMAEEKEAAALREQQAIKLYQMKMKQMKEKEEAKFKVPSKPGLLDKTFNVTDSGKQQEAPDCNNYGIDSSDSSEDESYGESNKSKRPHALWAIKENRLPVSKTNQYKHKDYYKRIFVCERTTPDIKSMFSQYNIKQRPRTSSAVWQTPPCYTMLPRY